MKFQRFLKITLATIALSLVVFPALARTIPAKPLHSAHGSTPLAKMLAKVMPAVVNVSVVGEVPLDPQEALDPKSSKNKEEGEGGSGHKFTSMGSGVIVDGKHGFVITNAHVIRFADTITVTTSNGRKFEAELVGKDNLSDLAVLNIKGKNLAALPLGNSDNLEVGDGVVAIGSPFGLNQTVTRGIVSALQRRVAEISGYEDFIQTDASINPGNSGGALVNAQGELIGINTAILAPYGANVGIGFAIPVNVASSVMQQILKYGKVRRGLLGVMVQDFTPELADAFHKPGFKGALATQVNPGSPADQAGLKSGDIITKLNGKKILTASMLGNYVGLVRAGNTIRISVLRGNKRLNLHAILMDRHKQKARNEARDPFFFGTAMMDFHQKTITQGEVRGVLITHIRADTSAYRAGVRRGDVIIWANKQTVTNLKALGNVEKTAQEQLIINVLRGTGGMFMVIKRAA